METTPQCSTHSKSFPQTPACMVLNLPGTTQTPACTVLLCKPPRHNTDFSMHGDINLPDAM
ncbi:unnamed protein product, partial [Staurois parvus]